RPRARACLGVASGAAGGAAGDRVRAPDGYTALRRWRVRALVRTDLVAELTPWLLTRRLVVPQGSQAVQGGRGGAPRARLPGGLAAVVRFYRRGGWLPRGVRESYLRSTARPFREPAGAAAGGRRGVP